MRRRTVSPPRWISTVTSAAWLRRTFTFASSRRPSPFGLKSSVALKRVTAGGGVGNANGRTKTPSERTKRATIATITPARRARPSPCGRSLKSDSPEPQADVEAEAAGRGARQRQLGPPRPGEAVEAADLRSDPSPRAEEDPAPRHRHQAGRGAVALEFDPRLPAVDRREAQPDAGHPALGQPAARAGQAAPVGRGHHDQAARGKPGRERPQAGARVLQVLEHVRQADEVEGALRGVVGAPYDGSQPVRGPDLLQAAD